MNEDKTKYIVSTTKDIAYIEPSALVDNYTFEVVNNFVYPGTTVNTTNNASLEIQPRLTLADRYSYGFNRQLSSKALSPRTKLMVYKTLIIPVLIYGAESWTMSAADVKSLGEFKRKILRMIFGAISVNGEYRRRISCMSYTMMWNWPGVCKFSRCVG